jgi:hypothetical protein
LAGAAGRWLLFARFLPLRLALLLVLGLNRLALLLLLQPPAVGDR